VAESTGLAKESWMDAKSSESGGDVTAVLLVCAQLAKED
jgi:hypothetical protein